MKTSYFEKLKDPRWQKRRLDIFELYNFECSNCGDNRSTLHAHHVGYRKNTEPWDYGDTEILCLCEDCHKKAHKQSDNTKELLRFVAGDTAKIDQIIGYIKGILCMDMPVPTFSITSCEEVTGFSNATGLSEDVITGHLSSNNCRINGYDVAIMETKK